MLALFCFAWLGVQGWPPPHGPVLQPWSKASSDGAWEFSVDPDDRSGLGTAQTRMRDAGGQVRWSKRLEFALHDAEVTRTGDVVGWTANERDSGRQLGIAVLDSNGEPRSVEWLSRYRGGYVKSIVLVPAADRAVVRLEDMQRGDVIRRIVPEEWIVLQPSTGKHLGRFVPQCLQGAGLRVLSRAVCIEDRSLLACELFVDNPRERSVVFLDLDGRTVGKVAFEESRPSHLDSKRWIAWCNSPARIASPSPGRIQFQFLAPPELVTWSITERGDMPGTWTVEEVSRSEHAPGFDTAPEGIAPRSFDPRILQERALGELVKDPACAGTRWSDAILDAQGRLLVLEPQQSHVHEFDSEGATQRMILLEEAGPHVDTFFGVSPGALDLGVGDSFATWDRSGKRLTEAYAPYHRAWPLPLRHAHGGRRWFCKENELLLFVGESPEGVIAKRILRRPDQTWFDDIEGGSQSVDGSLVVLDVAPVHFWIAELTRVSRFDADGKGRDTLLVRLPLRPREGLSTDGHWLVGRSMVLDTGFLLDLDRQRLFALDSPCRGKLQQLLLPKEKGEFWIVNLAEKRLLRAALPGD